MKIEILDDLGNVIRTIDNTSSPELEVVIHGGAFWREWIEPDEARLELLRRQKIQETQAEARTRIAGVDPEVGQFMHLMPFLTSYFTVTGTGAGEWNRMKGMDDHSRTKQAWLQTATEAELDAYDPTTDSGWPS